MAPRTISGAILGRQVKLGPVGGPQLMPELFVPVTQRQQSSFPKPDHGGGMWTSSPTEDGLCDWARWCASESFHVGEFVKWVLTPRPTATLLEVDDYEDLVEIHKAFGRTTSWTGRSSERLFVDHILQFEEIAKHYDGFHLTEDGQWATRLSHPLNLYGWDCESTLWFKWAFVDIVNAGTVIVGNELEAAE